MSVCDGCQQRPCVCETVVLPTAENGLRISPPPPGKHDCREALPWRSGGYGSTGYPEGSVALCPSCRRAWVCLPCYQSLGPVTWWRPVWWFSRRDYRRRAAQLRRVIPPGSDGGAS